LLILDDLQFFSGKRCTQVELLYTIDTLLREGRQLVFAADRPPAELSDLGPELTTRLASGMVCRIELPDYQTRLGIVARMADRVVVMYAGRLVEEGSGDTIFGQPHHPYTWGLLDSIPRLDDERGEKLIPIPGSPPSLIRKPTGCAFHPRCRSRRMVCDKERPESRQVGPGHTAACILAPGEAKAERQRVERAASGQAA